MVNNPIILINFFQLYILLNLTYHLFKKNMALRMYV